MDEACTTILNKLIGLTECGKYIIVEQNDLCEWLQTSEDEPPQTLLPLVQNAVQTLQKEGYLDLKYARGDYLCVAPLKPYEAQPATPSTTPTPTLPKTNLWLVLGMGGVGSFIGSFFACLLVRLLC